MRTPNPGDIPDTFTNIDDELVFMIKLISYELN